MSQSSTDVSKILGEFWTRVWKEQKLVDGMTNGLGQAFEQLDTQTVSTQPYLSRFQMPLTFFRHWDYLTINEEDLVAEVVKIGEITISQFKIGGEKLPKRWDFDKNIENCSLLLSSPINPSVIWTKGQEFTVIDGKIVFYKDPFATFDVSITVSADGRTLKRCQMWLSSTETDMGALKDHFGVYFNLNVPSQLFYQRIVNSVWDLRVQGATSLNIRQMLASIADSEVCMADGTITDTWTENGRAWVAVGDRLYSASSPSVSIVAVEDTVSAGDLLFDTFTIYSPGTDVPVAFIPAMQLDSGFLSGSYEGGLLFENRDFDLDYIYASGMTDVTVLTQGPTDGYLLVETDNGITRAYIDSATDLAQYGIVKLPIFPLGGAPESIKQYRQDMAGKAYELNIDLWSMLTAGQAYPYTINPFAFLKENVFSSNMFFVKYKAGTISAAAPLQAAIRQLTECVPAGSSFLIFLETGSTLMETLSSSATDGQEDISHTGSTDELTRTVKSESLRASPAIF